MREQKKHWEKEIERIQQNPESIRARHNSYEDVQRFCGWVKNKLRALTPQEKKEFRRLVLDRIWKDWQNNLEVEVVVSMVEKESSNDDVICEIPISLTKGDGEVRNPGVLPRPSS